MLTYCSSDLLEVGYVDVDVDVRGCTNDRILYQVSFMLAGCTTYVDVEIDNPVHGGLCGATYRHF